MSYKTHLHSFRLTDDDEAKLDQIMDSRADDEPSERWTRTKTLVWCIRKVHDSLTKAGKIKAEEGSS